MRSLRAALRFSSRLKEHLFFCYGPALLKLQKETGGAHGSGGRSIEFLLRSRSRSLSTSAASTSESTSSSSSLEEPFSRLTDADITIFNPEEGWKVVSDTFKSKSKNSPFDGRPVQGRVLRTVIDGRTVFDVMPKAAAHTETKRAAAKAR